LISLQIVSKLQEVGKVSREEILEASQRILYLAQNFDNEFPGLENLKSTHFTQIKLLL